MTTARKQGRITRDDFMRVFEVYELWKYESEFSLFYQDSKESNGAEGQGKKKRGGRFSQGKDEGCCSNIG